MPDPLLDPILRRIEQAGQSGARLGTVTAVDGADGSATVSMAGDVVPGLGWVGATPVVADVVVVARLGSAWFITGKLSRQFTATTAYDAVTMTPDATWSGSLGGAWTWSAASDGVAGQGLADTTLAGVWYLPDLALRLPTGATVTAAKLRMTRWAPEITVAESNLVAPQLRMHAYSAIPTGAPVWTGTTWAPGALARGQTGVWDLPSEWLTALLAGTALGVGVTSAAAIDHAQFSGVQVEVSYSTPS